ncbi:MAG: bifunctional adenosylcobinamide kinase/adenosylcobinamide-phosphate guanylyltransferase [bacterium]|nr:bifunctional adenosylcobinamide kinase/adenosylcobinamide-phosphate guanylyltransferase [bacterium]
MKQLILGGMRSGKSTLAENLAGQSGLSVTYIATATAGDSEMSARIKAHQDQRPSDWQLIEEPIYLARTLREQSAKGHCLLIDCLTLWVTNLLLHEDSNLIAHQKTELFETLPDLQGEIIFVSNETNMGLVPMDALSRRFCDETGRVHQEIAQIVERVALVVAGLPHVIKGDQI